MVDLQKPQFRVSALTGGQRQYQATIAWVEGPVAKASAGRLVVADVRLDGKLQRFASRPLPGDWGECRLWMEENPESESVMQAVALCPQLAPLRLSASGNVVPGLGPDRRPPTLYSISPLTRLDPEKVVQRVHRHDLSPPHPLLFLLGLLAMIPLLRSALLEWRRARRLQQAPLLSGVLENAGAGVMTIKSGSRRVSVFVEQGEVLSVGLRGGDLRGGDAMAVDGLRASVQGEADQAGDGAFRGGESLRLRRGAVLVVGDDVAEARRRVLQRAARDVGVALGGAALAAAMAAGMIW